MTEATRRRSEASVALICRNNGEGVRWLARWNKHWGCYYFVGGHRHADESFLECLIRELGEELGVEHEKDFAVTPVPVARLEFVAWSKSAKAQTEYKFEVFGVTAETEYTLELFGVSLRGDDDGGAIRSRQSLRWLSEREIRALRGDDGQPVSDTMLRVLNEIGWKCPEGMPPGGCCS